MDAMEQAKKIWSTDARLGSEDYVLVFELEEMTMNDPGHAAHLMVFLWKQVRFLEERDRLGA